MELSWPCRIIIVGGSGTGKTYLVRTLLLRGDLGTRKRQLDIVLITPQKSSMEQDIWKDLGSRGYKINKVLCQRGRPAPDMDKLFGPVSERKRLLIIDDVDHAAGLRFTGGLSGREWLMDLFGTESHHSNVSVILICHHLKIGCPAIKNSADGIIITGLPRHDLHSLCKDLLLSETNEESIANELANPRGVVGSGKYVTPYNNVFVLYKPKFMSPNSGDKQLEPVPILWRFDNKVSGSKGLLSI